jgi:hypothetical protein
MDVCNRGKFAPPWGYSEFIYFLNCTLLSSKFQLRYPLETRRRIQCHSLNPTFPSQRILPSTRC